MFLWETAPQMQKGDGVMDQKKWKKQSLNVVIGSMISVMMFNFLTTVSVNIFIPAVAEMKNMGTAPLYNANTIGNLVSVLIALAIGMLSQKISLKKISVFGLFLAGFSYLMIPLVPPGMTGIFIASNYIATMFYAQLAVGARIGNWYPRRKGEMLGIVTSIIVVSSILLLPVYSRASERFGIKNTMIVCGMIVIVWAAVSIFQIKDYPYDVGLNPENMSDEEAKEFGGGTGSDTYDEKSEWNYLLLLKRPRFVFSAVGWGLSFIGIMGLSLAIVPIMRSKGVSADMAVTIASFAGLFQLAGSIVSGFLDTRVGQRFVITLFLCLEILGLLIFGFAPGGMIALMVGGYYIVMFMMGAPNNLQPSMYLSMAGGGGRTFMIFNSLQTAIAATLRSFSSSILAFSTEHTNGSYSIAMPVFLVGAIASVILLNICGFKKMELPSKSV